MRTITKYIFVILIWFLSIVRRLYRGRRQVELEDSHCLVVSLSGIGNAIMCLPLLQALKEQHGAAAVDVLTTGAAQETIFRNIGFTDEIYKYPLNLRQKCSLLLFLRKKKYDALLLAFPTPEISYAVLPTLINPRTALTHDYSMFHPFFKYLGHIADRVLPIRTDLHDIEQNLHLIESCNVNKFEFKAYPTVHLSKASLENADEFYRKNKLGSNSILCFMHPGSKRGADYKRWPVANFLTLGQLLVQENNIKIVAIIGPDEIELRDQFAKSGFILLESTDFATTLAILSRASFLVSNDSGLMHTAALLEIPTVTVWGGTDVSRNGARGNLAINVMNKSMPCRPCVKFVANVRCPDAAFLCIRSIDAEQVYQSIKSNGLLKPIQMPKTN